MDNYTFYEAIGQGSFGRVFRGLCLSTGDIIALKVIPKRNKIDSELKSLRRECEIQKDISHPNIVCMVDSFETNKEIVAVSEYVPIPLMSLLESHGTISEKRTKSIACHLVSALYYLHSRRIIHRDIKPQNILLTEHGQTKLCDFGFSRKMGRNTFLLTSIKGTPLYMAPELINECVYDHKADLWSLGCILYELLTGKPPFSTTSIGKLIELIKSQSVLMPESLSSNCSSFLEGLLQKEPNHRLNWPHILQAIWIKDEVRVYEEPLQSFALTSPLSTSQQEMKEVQMRQLINKGICQGFINEYLSKDIQSNIKSDICPEKLKLSNLSISKTITNENDLCNSPPVNPLVNSNIDVREGVGGSVRKLSAISNESGFKEIDVADLDPLANIPQQGRKDSMANYLSDSSSSRRNSHNSVPTLDNNYGLSLPNICEESVSVYQNDVGGENMEKVIEAAEWTSFLDKTIGDVMKQNFEIFQLQSELSMFVVPLQSKTCPEIVVDKIASLLILPFVLKQQDIEKIVQVYIECKVVPNLIFAIQNLSYHQINQNSLENPNICLELTILICHLIYRNEAFVHQFCDTVCVLSASKMLKLVMESNAEIRSYHIAILGHVLKVMPDQLSVVQQMLPNESQFLILLESKNIIEKERTQNLIKYLLRSCHHFENKRDIVQKLKSVS